jgi:hypothetical protein
MLIPEQFLNHSNLANTQLVFAHCVSRQEFRVAYLFL